MTVLLTLHVSLVQSVQTPSQSVFEESADVCSATTPALDDAVRIL